MKKSRRRRPSRTDGSGRSDRSARDERNITERAASGRDSDYEVGYGKPPRHTQFQPGVSGNPKGRPKGSRNFQTDVQATLKQPVRINANGRTKNISTQQASLLRLREKALAGDARSLDRLIDLARTYNAEEMAEATEAALSSDDQDILDQYLARQARRERPRLRASKRKRLRKRDDGRTDDGD